MQKLGGGGIGGQESTLSFQDFSNKMLAKKVVSNLDTSYSDGPNWEGGFETSSHGGWPVSKVDFLIFNAQKGGEGSKQANISNRPQTVNDNETERDRSLRALRKRETRERGTAEVFSITKKKNNLFLNNTPRHWVFKENIFQPLKYQSAI